MFLYIKSLSICILTSFFDMTSRVRDAAGGDAGAGASEERASTEAKRTPKQPDPNL
ncbi:hypothetical protein QF024_000523 [Chryseobacterium nepalense]|nr:hypothetical protein [Chryseobacterium nepalense]